MDDPLHWSIDFAADAAILVMSRMQNFTSHLSLALFLLRLSLQATDADMSLQRKITSHIVTEESFQHSAATAHTVRWYRSSYYNAVILGLCKCCRPALSLVRTVLD